MTRLQLLPRGGDKVAFRNTQTGTFMQSATHTNTGGLHLRMAADKPDNGIPKWKLTPAGGGYYFVTAPQRQQLTTQRCIGSAVSSHECLMEAAVMGELQMWLLEDASVCASVKTNLLLLTRLC